MDALTPVRQQRQEVRDPNVAVAVEVRAARRRTRIRARPPGAQQEQEIRDPDPAVAVEIRLIGNHQRQHRCIVYRIAGIEAELDVAKAALSILVADGGGVGITDFLALLANWGPCL